MKRLIMLGAVWALAVARPELYKEKEDFQYSRSSSDDGSKSGFYGAQRGNMGGNYERAHNMDSLAQNQMSGLVRQVEGELGDGVKTRAGSVYTAANSRGTYGSGHFDLSNLEGRNFQEGTFYGDSQSRASLSSSSAYNAAGHTNSLSQHSRRNGYQAVGTSGLNVVSDDLQSLDNSQATGQYDYGRQSSHSTGYSAQSGFQQHSAFDTSNANVHYGGHGSNAQTRLISATPVRIIVRPGTRVAIPVAAQTYDIKHGSALVDQNSLNSEAEILSNDNHHTLYRPGSAKHYESSYNYRKEWEKHDTVPSAVTLPTTPTENPFPRNSELYEDNQARTAGGHYDATRVDSQRAQSGNTYGGYNVKSTSGQSRSAYDAQHHGALYSNTNAYTLAGHNAGSTLHAASSDSSQSDNIQSQYNAGSRYHAASANSNALTQAGYNTGFNADLNSQVENLNAKPKSYQSSYSYHKSWEHQGDPYVIKPASSGYYDGQYAQRLTTGSTKNQAYAATGSHYKHSHLSEANCDENAHIRVARSYNADQYQDTQQQSQNIEDMGQQIQDLGQQSQNPWDHQEVVQQAQNTWDRLEDLSQQSHNQWDQILKKWDRLEDLGQKPQSTSNQFQDLEQKSQHELGPQTQDTGVGHQQDVVQKVQDKRDFSNTGLHSQENYQNQDYHHEQSHKFNHYENQHDLQVFEMYNHSQQSQKHTDNKQDHISVRDQGVINGGIEQKPHDSISHVDKLSQSESHNVNNNYDDEKFLEQLASNTQQSNTVNSDSSYLNFFSKDDKSFQIPDKFYEINNGNIYNSHRTENFTNSNSYSHVNNFKRIPPNTAPLLSLWNKLDRIEQQSTLSDNGNMGGGNDFSQVQTSQSSYQNSLHEHTNNTDGTFTQYHYNQIKPHPEHQLQINSEESQYNLNNAQADKDKPQDLGRGDIGPEDVSDVLEDKMPYPPVTSVIEKAIKNNTNTVETGPLHPSLLSIHGLGLENTPIYKNENSVSNASHTYSQNRDSYHQNQLQQQDENSQQENLEFEQKNMQKFHQVNSDQQRNFEQENLEQQNLHDFGPHDNLEQQNLQEFGQHEHSQQQNLEHFDQKHLEQNLQDFGQQANLEQFEQHENLEQHNLQDFGQQVNLQQQDFGKHENREQQNLQDFGQQANLDQQDFGKHENLEQQNLQDFGQQVNLQQQDFGKHENREQQNLQDFEQQANLEQQDFGKHENLEQQNLQDFGQQANLEQQDFGKHENLEQQNLQDFGQQVNLQQQDFGKHENLEQQNLQDFGQQANLDQQDFRKYENLEQQNLQDFGQQVNLQQQDFGKHENREQQNLQGFGQQANLEQQYFGKHENLEQQNLQDFGQQANLEQQDFGKHENLEQQNLQAFGQQANLQQQDFGKHENLEQQNLQDFGQQANSENQDFRKHENIEQQNLHDFGQHENSDQQSLQDFGHQANLEHFKHENLEQQNLKNFGQQENLEQQNLQDFGQHENLGQHNLEYSGQQEYLEQQNLKELEQRESLDQYYRNAEDIENNKEKPQNNMKPQINLQHPEEVEEHMHIQNQNNDLTSIPEKSQNTVGVLPLEPVLPIEPVTEKPGFWKSVGNKFSTAKSKIASWFKS